MSAFVELLERVRRAVPVRLLADFHALGLVDEYVRFLALKLARNDTRVLPPSLSPSHAVDQVWQTHMLHPQAYMATCRALFPNEANGACEVIVYSPAPNEYTERYAKTLANYEQHFGIAPHSDVWPASYQSPPLSLSPPAQVVAAAELWAPKQIRSAAANIAAVTPSSPPPSQPSQPSQAQLPANGPASPPSSSSQPTTTKSTVQVPVQEQTRSSAANTTAVVPSPTPLPPAQAQLPAREPSLPATQPTTTSGVSPPERRRSAEAATTSPSSSPPTRRKRSRSCDREPRGIVIYANVPFGRKYAITLPNDASVALLQQRIAEHVRIPIDQQSLVFEGHALEETPSALLQRFRVKNQSTVRLSMRLC